MRHASAARRPVGARGGQQRAGQSTERNGRAYGIEGASRGDAQTYPSPDNDRRASRASLRPQRASPPDCAGIRLIPIRTLVVQIWIFCAHASRWGYGPLVFSPVRQACAGGPGWGAWWRAGLAAATGRAVRQVELPGKRLLPGCCRPRPRPLFSASLAAVTAPGSGAAFRKALGGGRASPPTRQGG
jgi:hypothetical protein